MEKNINSNTGTIPLIKYSNAYSSKSLVYKENKKKVVFIDELIIQMVKAM